MDVSLLSKTFTVRRLDINDTDIIYDLCQANDTFYKYHPPFVSRESIIEDMVALPPGKTLEDKYYLGFFKGDCFVAVMDLILGYPTRETAYIGFFMTDVTFQNRGIGSRIVRETVDGLKSRGFEKIRLGVDKENLQSYAFWVKNGFEVVREDKYILMELVL